MATMKYLNPETGLWENIGMPTESVGMQMDLLWTNPDPTAEFAAQTVALDLSVYDFVSIKFKTYTEGNDVFYAYGKVGDILNVDTWKWIRPYWRAVTIQIDGITFSGCSSCKGFDDWTFDLTAASVIPTEIYGIRNTSSSNPTGDGTTESINHPGCFYRMVNGVQEWLNPPMEMGVEYKTAERHLGKPVYMQALDFGNLPNNTAKYTDPFLPLDVLDCVVDMTPYHTITSAHFNSDTYIRHMGYKYLSTATQQLEFNYSSSDTHLVGKVLSNYDASAQKGYMVFKYTKTTD